MILTDVPQSLRLAAREAYDRVARRRWWHKLEGTSVSLISLKNIKGTYYEATLEHYWEPGWDEDGSERPGETFRETCTVRLKWEPRSQAERDWVAEEDGMITYEMVANQAIDAVAREKMQGDLTDSAPLVSIMYLVADEIGKEELLALQERACKAWCEAMKQIQEGVLILEHNEFLPCRWCDQAFEPVVDEDLLLVFLVWYEEHHSGTEAFLALHRCPACEGKIKAKQVKTYMGDMYTPKPGSIENDEWWADKLLEYCFL